MKKLISIMSCLAALACLGEAPLDPCGGPGGQGGASGSGTVAQSCDPNEISGPVGIGEARCVAVGDWMDYTIYFENKTNATAAAQEVFVDLPMDENLDWSTLELGEIAFGDHIDSTLVGKSHGKASYAMPGTNTFVKTEVKMKDGILSWYMRDWDPTTTDNFPASATGGFLPPNDPETHCGEGHLSFRVKVKPDAPNGAVIRASASIVFDTNPAITTDPSWSNTVARLETFFLDLGDGTTTNIVLVVGQPFGELPTPADREGFAFGGWYTGPDGTGTLVTPETPVEAGVTLHPFWIDIVQPPTTYTIAFASNGGTGSMTSLTATVGASVALPANAFAKDGCVFLGWAESANGPVVFAGRASVADLAAAGKTATLHARWAVLNYTVSFNRNGGKAPKKKKMKALAMTYGIPRKLPKNIFTRANYVFLGWSLAKKGGTIYKNKATVQNLTTEGGTVTLYAQWAKKTYKVKFVANGGKGKMDTLSMTYGKAKKLTANKFTRSGYKFAGWAKSKADAKAGKTTYKNKKKVKNLTTTGKTVKLYAVWKSR